MYISPGSLLQMYIYPGSWRPTRRGVKPRIKQDPAILSDPNHRRRTPCSHSWACETDNERGESYDLPRRGGEGRTCHPAGRRRFHNVTLGRTASVVVTLLNLTTPGPPSCPCSAGSWWPQVSPRLPISVSSRRPRRGRITRFSDSQAPLLRRWSAATRTRFLNAHSFCCRGAPPQGISAGIHKFLGALWVGTNRQR